MYYPIPKDRVVKNRQNYDIFDGIEHMKLLKLRALTKKNETLKKIYKHKYNITNEFRQEVRGKTKENRTGIPQHMIIQIYGDTGMGKSEAGKILAEEDIARTPDDIFVYMEQTKLLEKIGERKVGDVVILDEQPLRAGMGSSRESMQLKNLEEVTRKFQLSFIFISPTIRVHQTAHYWLRALVMNTGLRINRLAVQEPSTGECLGYIDLKIPTEETLKNRPLSQKYEVEKDEFINEVITGKVRSDYLPKLAVNIMNNQDFSDFKSKNKVTLDALKVLIMKTYPTLTTAENTALAQCIKIFDKNPELMKRWTTKQSN